MDEIETTENEDEEEVKSRLEKEEALAKARKENPRESLIEAIKGLRRNKQRNDIADDPRIRYPE
jgi:hypothetical protein